GARAGELGSVGPGAGHLEREQAAGGRVVGARRGPVDAPCCADARAGVAGVGDRRGEVGDRTVAGRRRLVRAAEHVVAHPHPDRVDPRRQDLGLAAGVVDRRVRRPDWHQPPRTAGVGRRAHHGARLRPRHHGTAAVRRTRVHLGWHGRAGRGHRPDRRARHGPVVGAVRDRWSMAVDALAVAGELGVVQPDRSRGDGRAAPRRLRLPPRRRGPAGEGAPGLRAGRVDRRAVRLPPAPPGRAAVEGDAAPSALVADGLRGARCSARARARPARVLGGGRRPRTRGCGGGGAGPARCQCPRSGRLRLGARGGRPAGARRRAVGQAHGRGGGARHVEQQAARRRAAGSGDPARGRRLHLPERRPTRVPPPGPHDPGREVTGDRRAQRRRQDHVGEAPVPSLRPDLRGDHRRRTGPPHPRRRRVAQAGQRGVPGLRALRAVPAPQRRPRRCGARRCAAAAPPRGRRCGGPGAAGPAAVEGAARRHRPVRWAVATGGAGPGPGRRAPRRRRGHLGRADRPARRAGRGGHLRTAAGRHRRLHDDPHLPSVLHGAPRRPHRGHRGRARDRAGLARRADGCRRPLPGDVRPPGVPLQRRESSGPRRRRRSPRGARGAGAGGGGV
ncbi:MAG: Efflux ABC transporter, permease/ATP-binding protein, partial [uncultured Acidimicrobiales bacterium]